ncbi:MAG: VWA domain-containing protein [Planctomycetes bacterium]|nr:VWA domain-containing protein [Planctomycetota bacterium]
MTARWLVLGVTLALAAGCGESRRVPSGKTPPPPAAGARSGPRVDLPRGEDRLCTAVAVLLDASSSMLQGARDRTGRERPKHEIAREALEGIIGHTAEWLKAHPDTTLELGIFQFSSSVSTLLPMGPFDAAKARDALARARSSSGTAIGRAIETGYRALYASGCLRKHIVCITDGENTSGPAPEMVARLYHSETEGAVPIHMVAFDTSSKKFRFLGDVGGDVTEAAGGAELQARLGEIYDKRIFAEEMPAEEMPAER